MKYTLATALLLNNVSARLWSETNCSECSKWPDYADYCLPACIKDDGAAAATGTATAATTDAAAADADMSATTTPVIVVPAGTNQAVSDAIAQAEEAVPADITVNVDGQAKSITVDRSAIRDVMEAERNFW